MAEQYQALTTVLHVVAHNLIKEKNTTAASVDPRQGEIEVTPLAQRLVDVLYTEYKRKASKSFGKFDGKEDHAPSQKYLRLYFKDKNQADSLDFYNFSLKMMGALETASKKVASSTGGHVFFAHLRHDANDFLLVAVITDEQAIALTKAKDLEPVEHLNVRGFRFAGRVDLTAWVGGEERYVSFLKGTGDVADYFKSFLACDTAITALRDTQQLTSAVRSFAMGAERNGQKLTELEREDFFRKVDVRCREMADAGEPLSLEAFANEMWPTDPSQFLETLTASEYKLSDGFVPNKRGLVTLVKFRGKGTFWTLEFEREALSSKQVIFNEEDQSLRLYGLPDDLVKRLKEEMDA